MNPDLRGVEQVALARLQAACENRLLQILLSNSANFGFTLHSRYNWRAEAETG